MISWAIKEREEFIINKNFMVITADSRIVNALNSSSMLSSKSYSRYILLAQKGRIHLLLRDIEEEKTVKGLKTTANKNRERYIVAEAEN